MSKELVRAYHHLYDKAHGFALAKPNLATALLILAGMALCVVLWLLVVPIFSPDSIAQYLPLGSLQ